MPSCTAGKKSCRFVQKNVAKFLPAERVDALRPSGASADGEQPNECDRTQKGTRVRDIFLSKTFWRDLCASGLFVSRCRDWSKAPLSCKTKTQKDSAGNAINAPRINRRLKLGRRQKTDQWGGVAGVPLATECRERGRVA